MGEKTQTRRILLFYSVRYHVTTELTEAKRIYPSITADVWAKPEGDAYRCLVGPYKNFSNAKQDLARVKRLRIMAKRLSARYQEAQLRKLIHHRRLKSINKIAAKL